MAQPRPEADERLLTFRVGEDRFGVAATLVREVGRMPRLTRVPHAPAGLLGLGNFRGEVLPILAFGLRTSRAQTAGQRVILLDTANPIALAVDEVNGFAANTALRGIDAEALAANKALSPSGERVGRGATPSAKLPPTRQKAVETREAEVPLLAFAIAAQEFALPIGAVAEILPLPAQFAILPHADAAVVGSISWRDALLPLLSLAALLALPAAPAGTRHNVIVVRIGTHRVGLVVDALRGVLRVAESRIDAVPPVLTRGSAEAKIQAICRLDGGERLVSVLAVEHLVRDDLTASLLNTAGSETDMATMAGDEASGQFLIFRIGDAEFGLPIGAVIEVATLPPTLASLPQAPPFVKGIMSLRGHAVPVIDQSLRFIGTPARGARQRVVVVRIGTLVAGFLVDAVADVRRFALASLRSAPELGGEGTRVFDRIAPGGDEAAMVLIVSPQELLDHATREVLAATGGTARPS